VGALDRDEKGSKIEGSEGGHYTHTPTHLQRQSCSGQGGGLLLAHPRLLPFARLEGRRQAQRAVGTQRAAVRGEELQDVLAEEGEGGGARGARGDAVFPFPATGTGTSISRARPGAAGVAVAVAVAVASAVAVAVASGGGPCGVVGGGGEGRPGDDADDVDEGVRGLREVLGTDPRPPRRRPRPRRRSGSAGLVARVEDAPARVWLCQAVQQSVLGGVAGHAAAGLHHHAGIQAAHAPRPGAGPVLDPHLDEGTNGRRQATGNV